MLTKKPCSGGLLAKHCWRMSQRCQRMPQRLGLERRSVGSSRCNNRCEAELMALLDAPRRLRRRAQATRQADLAEGRRAVPNRRTARRRGDGERDAEVG